MTSERTAWVIGATGLVGSAILNLLLDSGDFTAVVALVRRASGRSHPRLVERVTDFDNLAQLKVPAPQAVFCTLGTTIKIAGSAEAFRRIDYALPLRIATQARDLGAQHFLLVSSVGADVASPNNYLQVKGELERDIATLGYPAFDIFQPSVLLGPRAQLRPGELFLKVAAFAVGFLLLGGLRRYRAIRAIDVAQAMVHAARQTEPGLRRLQYNEIMSLATHAK